MLATILATARLLAQVARALADPAARGIVVLALIVIAIGTVFYTRVEGWRALDAVYFTVVTLTTIGFGDLVPTSDAGKVFTIVYSLVGVGIIAAFVTTLALSARDRAARRHGPRRRGPEHG